MTMAKKHKHGVVYNAAGLPFSGWKPAEKFAHVLADMFPVISEECDKEYEFSTNRKWRFDFAWPSEMLAVEVDGFGYGHQAQQHMAVDNEKQNAAVASGWRVLRYNSRQLGSLAGCRDAVDQVCSILCGV